ncbi:hypothetical protein CFP56_021426 [Quercus suber]|uniref:Uncharacterized protein n=1 Tax=Quercus suber TaxID=58331 RepID=A0AAW0KDS2_QUESU
MLRRKPSKIEVKIEDKDELEQARKHTATATTSASDTTATALLHHLDRRNNKDPSSVQNRIGLSSQ